MHFHKIELLSLIDSHQKKKQNKKKVNKCFLNGGLVHTRALMVNVVRFAPIKKKKNYNLKIFTKKRLTKCELEQKKNFF